MVDFNQIEQFLVIVKEGTLSKAAEVLHISQPALTRSMKRLEDTLGFELFDHGKNKITLNDTGQLAQVLFTDLFDHQKEVIHQLQTYQTNKEVFTIASCAPAPIWAFEDVRQQLPLPLKTSLDSNQSKLLSQLRSKELRCVVLTHPVKEKNFRSFYLFEEQLYLCVPPAHPLALLKSVSFEDINGESVLLFSKIGFWNEICLKHIPDSHLLIQEDMSVFNELRQASALPNFKSNITLKKDNTLENRVVLPITDPDAKASYYAICRNEDRKTIDLLETLFPQKKK